MESNMLLLSQRRIYSLVAFCLVYEFEDVFQEVTNAERIDVADLAAVELSRRAYKLLRKTTGSARLAHQLAPHPKGATTLQGDYELFVASFSHAYQLYSLSAVPNWRQRCDKAVCYITEAWPQHLPDYLLELLSNFDHVFLGGIVAVDEVARLTGRPCSYLPLATDVLRFKPQAVDQSRPIDVCGIGRRSEVTHKALLRLVEEQGIFYYYDTVAASGTDLKDRTFRVDNPQQHRAMLANILKRSRFFLANRGHVNNPAISAEHDAISARYYEGAAAGAIMVGEEPKTKQFAEEFDWPDATVSIPFDSPDIGDRLAELNRDPERLQAMSAANVRNAAHKHDWLHRVIAMFDTFGIAATQKMRQRAADLEQVASSS